MLLFLVDIIMPRCEQRHDGLCPAKNDHTVQGSQISRLPAVDASYFDVSTLSLQIRELQTYHPIPLLFDFKNAVTL